MTITGAAPAHYDPNFACCGGCSSKRADAYNDKLATGSLVFIWDIKLKTDPQPVCTLTFPYDPALNEQVGERRVRSGRLVGTSYPIDNDYDYLCCEQRGQCLALNEDASGKCQCVKRWGSQVITARTAVRRLLGRLRSMNVFLLPLLLRSV